MQLFRCIAPLFGLISVVPALAGESIPPCERPLHASEFGDPRIIVERCSLVGRVVAAFTVGVDGRTSDISVISVETPPDSKPNAAQCLSEYARYQVQSVRYPVRDAACRTQIAFVYKDEP